jgi:hypothetical protein
MTQSTTEHGATVNTHTCSCCSSGFAASASPACCAAAASTHADTAPKLSTWQHTHYSSCIAAEYDATEHGAMVTYLQLLQLKLRSLSLPSLLRCCCQHSLQCTQAESTHATHPVPDITTDDKPTTEVYATSSCSQLHNVIASYEVTDTPGAAAALTLQPQPPLLAELLP